MEDEQHQIEFTFKNQDYTGLVTPGEREESITFVVQYCLSMSRQFEKTVELCICDKTVDPLNIEWKEQADEVGQLPTDPELVQLIGQAIEEHDL